MIIITPCPADLGYCGHGAIRQRPQANLALPGPRMLHLPVPFSLEGVLFTPRRGCRSRDILLFTTQVHLASGFGPEEERASLWSGHSHLLS